jgi:hypothetical protein
LDNVVEEGMDIKSGPVSRDNRFAPRRKRQLPGAIYFEGVAAGVRCMIVDISTTGARVKVAPGWDMALRNTGTNVKRARVIDLAAKVTYECHVVRIGPEELGLRFSAPPILPAVTAGGRSR